MNGKYFVPAEKTGEDFKALFKRLAHSGAGRPADASGAPIGLWTSDSLMRAIEDMDDTGASIDTRTVQLWFQDNDKGVSSENIKRLARIFGCGDADATSDWLAELAASQERLRAQRKPKKSSLGDKAEGHNGIDATSTAPSPAQPSLARRSEALFGRRGALLNLPMGIFAGAAALHFAAYLIGLDRITYTRADGVVKQVGFLSAPNWTLLFLIFLPLFFFFCVELLRFWKIQGRSTVLAKLGRPQVKRAWRSKVERSSFTYWLVFLICFLFAGILQWTMLRLLPLLRGADSDDIDWGSVAIMRPDAVTITQAVPFTGVAYAYMSGSFYLMVGGLILLWTLVHDFWEMADRVDDVRPGMPDEVDAVGSRIMQGIFRCSTAGLLVAICMKTQSLFLPTDAETVAAWLFADAGVVSPSYALGDYAIVAHWTSLLVFFPVCIVFLYAFARIGRRGPLLPSSVRMMAAFVLIAAAYLLIGAFPGFALLLGLAVLVALYGFFDPTFGAGRQQAMEEGRSVP